MEKLVTVFMPVYNKEPYLRHSLDSVLMQKVNFAYEILMIDDCSTDNSVSVIQEYMNRNPGIIKFIQNEKNIKTLATSLKGYSLIKTKYFTVLDPDDYWLTQDKMQNAINFLEKHHDFTMYMTNTYLKREGREGQDIFIASDDAVFGFDGRDSIISGLTSATFFRNIFSDKILTSLQSYIGTKDEISFEGDSFRNYLHLRYGKCCFKNVVESVYNLNENGIWTSLGYNRQHLENSRFYLNMYLYFDQCQPEFFLNKSLNYLRQVDVGSGYPTGYPELRDEVKKYCSEANIETHGKRNVKSQLKIVFYSVVLVMIKLPIIGAVFAPKLQQKISAKLEKYKI